MSSQQPNPYATGPQGYAQLSEEESHSPNKIGNPQQNAPVIVQGIPAMGYPVYSGAPPMSSFEIYPRTPSPLEKLKTWPYECYVAWLYLSVLFGSLGIFFGLLIPLLFGFPFKGIQIISFLLQSWQIYQCILVIIGMHKKSLEKIEKGILSMKIYLAVTAVFYLFQLLFAWEHLMEHGPFKEMLCPSGTCEKEQMIPVAGFMIGFFIGTIGFGFLVYLLPAIKVSKILKEASNQRMPSGLNA